MMFTAPGASPHWGTKTSSFSPWASALHERGESNILGEVEIGPSRLGAGTGNWLVEVETAGRSQWRRAG